MIKHGFALLLCLGIFVIGCQSPSPKRSKQGKSGNRNVSGKAGNEFHGLKKETVNGVNLVPIHFLDGKMSMLIPESFQIMSKEMLAEKYPRANGPKSAYANETGTVSIAANLTKAKVADGQLEAMHRYLDGGVRKAQPDAKWMFSGFQHYAGKKWIQLEFNSPVSGITSHNVMMATNFKGQLVVITFNTTDEESAKWLKVGRKMYPSVRISK